MRDQAAISDVERVRALLVDTARRRAKRSYSELLILLGHRFTRPKMRALCRTLDAIDRRAGEAGEPELAVLVVREADGLPGQGWWAEGRPMREGYEGAEVAPPGAGRVSERPMSSRERSDYARRRRTPGSPWVSA